MVRRQRVMALVTLALLNVFAIAAGATLVRLMPSLHLVQGPRVVERPVVSPGPVLAAADDSGPLPTEHGLTAKLSSILGGAALGPHTRALVADPVSGRVLFDSGGGSPATPASTTKLATSAAALETMGPDMRFATRVVRGSTQGDIVLVGGGDPTLAAGRVPASDYPQPATLDDLAVATARALRSAHLSRVRVRYDASLFTGTGMGPGWPSSDVTGGDVTPVTALEVDQGRLDASGRPQDRDDPGNYRARSPNSAKDAADAFVKFLTAQGIKVTSPANTARAASHARELARVESPPLSSIVERLLVQSDNVSAEALARQVAIARGGPASFSGGASAVTAVLRKLGVTSGLYVEDGSGLSPHNKIAPDALAQILALAAAPNHTELRPVITGLPVAGFSGTLSTAEGRFDVSTTAAALGVLRAKTGTLNGVNTLAGLVYDRDGRMLVFAFMADRVQDPRGATSELDKLAAAVAGCGCR